MSFNEPANYCSGKVAWATKAGAIENCQRIQKRGRGRFRRHKDKGRAVAALHPYRCPTCHHWHLGNSAEGKVAK